MLPQKGNPAAWRADRASKRFLLAAETSSNHTQALTDFQARSIARRFCLEIGVARLVASLAFREARL